MGSERKHELWWDLLGDSELGRRNLGYTTRLEDYRLMQFCFRDVLEARPGADATVEVFHDAGRLAGRHFAEHLLANPGDLGDYVAELHCVLLDLGVGILRVEKADAVNGRFVITVSEDLDCSGLRESGDSICTYDGGFVVALLESYTGPPFIVKEVGCWCTGDGTCRFPAEARAA
jgi:predicted hydrocarbon binding protein